MRSCWRHVINFSTTVSLSNWACVLKWYNRISLYLHICVYYKSFGIKQFVVKFLSYLLNLWWLVTCPCKYSEFWTISNMIGKKGINSICTRNSFWRLYLMGLQQEAIQYFIPEKVQDLKNIVKSDYSASFPFILPKIFI